MKAGDFDRRIRIEQATETPDSYGDPVKTWAALDHVWASVRPLRTEERFQAQQVNRNIELRMRMHYRSDVTVKMRILYDGDYYDIQGIKEIGRREGTELLCGIFKPEGG